MGTWKWRVSIESSPEAGTRSFTRRFRNGHHPVDTAVAISLLCNRVDTGSSHGLAVGMAQLNREKISLI